MDPVDRGGAVLLLNMGGPDSLKAVQPFLRNLFSDPAIITLPELLRRPLASFLSARRASKVIPRYRVIGGKSPIGELTRNQAAALAALLPAGFGPVLPAFSYWNPFIQEAVEAAAASGARRLVALSLYPQYCTATTGTCVEELSMLLPGTPFESSVQIIDSWPTHPGYLDALASTIEEAIEQVPEERKDDVVVLFSAHGVPRKLVDRGDPYLAEILATVNGVVGRLGGRPHELAFQSRLGPVKWLEPSLPEKLAELAAGRTPPLVIVPVSFVSDHIETLYELDIQHRAMAKELGFDIYVRAPALNSRPDFIAALADLVLNSLREGN
ncbi:MAG: ferrochelatase [bacterium]|nr:ferrochelatase [bacterium]